MSEPTKSTEELLDLFGDDVVRRILLLTSDTPMSADALADELEVSRPTVYRRVNTLVKYAFLRKNLETDADGHHYRTFELSLNEMSFEIDDGDLEITVEVDESLVDKFDGFLGGLEASYSEVSVGTDEESERTRSRGDAHYG